MSNENDPFKEFDTAEQNKPADNVLEDYIAPYKQMMISIHLIVQCENMIAIL